MARLDHWNLRTLDLEATVEFYVGLVGLRAGPFPGPAGAGAWLYDDAATPVLHVIRLDPDRREYELKRIAARLGDLAKPVDLDAKGSGVIDHVAFACEDFEAMVARLETAGVVYKVTKLPHLCLTQILVNDPNGVTLELNFRTPKDGCADA